MKGLKKFVLLFILIGSITAAGCAKRPGAKKTAMMSMPFGTAKDLAYANSLWNKMEQLGYNSTPSVLFTGPPPHGQVIEVLEGKINGKRIIVKRNYYGKNINC